MRVVLRLALLALVVALVPACGPGPGSGGAKAGAQAAGQVSDEVVRWLSRAKSALRGVNDVPTERGVQLGRGNASQTNFDDLLRNAPTEQSDEAARLATRMRALAAFDEAFRAAGQNVDQQWSTVNDDMYRLAYDSTSAETYQSTVNFLRDKGKQIVRDTVCEISWKQLTDKESSAILGLIDEGRFKTANTGTVKGLGNMSEKAAWEAIRDAAIKFVLGKYRDARFLDWSMYSVGIYKKGKEITASGNDVIKHPDGDLRSAFVTYTRLCLMPPR